MDDLEFNNSMQKSPQLIQNIQAGAVGPGRVAPPIATTSTQPPITNPNHPLNSGGTRVQKKVVPSQFNNIPNNMNAYGGGFNNYQYNRGMGGMTNMNMGGFNPYVAYGQPAMPANRQFVNPFVHAASENSRPAFESIQSVVQSFNSISMMLESTLTAMHMSFQALLSVAENFSRLRMFMMKLYSTIITFKLVRWFLTKLFYLLRMVRGGRELSTEEDLWTSLSSADHKEIIPSNARNWPLVVFTGILVTTPFLIYKLLNSVTPLPNSRISKILPSNLLIITSLSNWSNADPKTISLVKGKYYLTSQESIASAKETGWLLVDNFNRQQGYVPLNAFKLRKVDVSKVSHVQNVPKVSSNPAPTNSISEQVQPKSSISVNDVDGNPIALPHPLVNCNKSNIGKK